MTASVVLSGCVAQPGPAPVEPVGSTESSTVVPEVPVDKKNRNEIVVGIDPIRTGFNPHLASDDSAFVQSMARLVLPSAFVDGQMNSDVLLSAEEITPTDGAAQIVQYRINPSAQWSDGSPITGGDFRYLWEKMSTEAGVIDAAGYQAISDVRSTDGGRVVTVVFKNKVADWKSLFTNLLPSHLFSVGGESFDKVLATDVPASAGRYMVRSIDRKRGVVELARNDRFWGADPADVELLTFREVGNFSQIIEMLGNGQLSFAHVTPSETSGLALSLASGLQSRTIDRNTQLTATFNSRTLADQNLRGAIASVIDVPSLAKLAAGRTADVAIAEQLTPAHGHDLKAAIAEQVRPFKVAVDPEDETARGAAIAMVGMLTKAGFKAELVQSDLEDIIAKKVPAGEVDAVVSWQRPTTDPSPAASAFACQEGKPLASNVSGWCDEDLSGFLAEAMAGAHDSEAVRERMATVQAQHLSVPILRDRRMDILGTGIVAGESDLNKWPVIADASVLATAYTWKDD